MKSDFSEKEIKLMEALDISDDEIDFMTNHYSPIRVYDLLVSSVFMRNLNSMAVESLRRCVKAIYSYDKETKIYRNTEEFDNLIILE